MIHQLRITTLVENTVGRPDLLAEHGIAFWVEADGFRLLFDTGQGKVLGHNARKLGVPLDSADAVAFSHGHYDHTGGLAEVLGARPDVPIYLHPAAREPKYARGPRPPHRAIGMPEPAEAALRSHRGPITWTRGPTEIRPGMVLTGEIPRRTQFEDVGGPFFCDAECQTPDPLADDQALCIETPSGAVVVLGCAHSGVVNSLDYLAELTGASRFRAVLGGMHLVRADAERLDATIAALQRYDPRVLAAGHCTGPRAVTALWAALPDRCVPCAAGSFFRFDDEA
jgi:7,8-dihydropterin-6-yl-methyl-4-(beta-D-ribofuranosyl)aminobenzene 5'-phosphate synthase